MNFLRFIYLCLYVFNGQYLPTAYHFPIYTEYSFPFPSVNINATESWEESYHGAGNLKVLNE